MRQGGNSDKVREGGRLASCILRKHLSREESVRGGRKYLRGTEIAGEMNRRQKRSLFTENPGYFLMRQQDQKGRYCFKNT